MIGEKMAGAFNEQMKHEAESSWLYLSMSAWFESAALPGMARWMRAQAGEETGHAMRFFSEVVERGGRVELSAVAKPKSEWPSPLEAFKDAFGHERFITEKIDDLVRKAAKEGDFAAVEFLQWFVNEQVEEEAQVQKIVQVLERIGESGSGLVMLDHELGGRK